MSVATHAVTLPRLRGVASPTIPRVSGLPVLGNLFAFRADRTALLLRVAREHGDIAMLRLGVVPALVVSSAELAHSILVERDADFVKSVGLSLFARPLLGEGLLTSEGAFHKRQRRMMAPAFMHRRITGYADVMADRAERRQASWGDGSVIDVAAEAMRYTLEVVGKTLFDAEVGSDAHEVEEALTAAMRYLITSLGSVVPMPPSWPTPKNRKNRKTIERLDAIIYRLIRERRGSGGDRGDLLSMLLGARDEDDGGEMTDRQVRDEAMTIFLAGHETTANALAWALYLLSLHPDVRERLEREADQLGGRTPTFDDLPRLPYALQVLKEAMRLYPPAYVLGRCAQRDVRIGDHLLRAGTTLLVNIYGMHRRAEYFADPDRFDPNRFLPEKEKSQLRHAYLPFGAGARVCIGNHFALMEGQLALATFAQRVRLDLVSPAPIVPEPLITLRPRGGVRMRVTRR